MSDAMKAGLQLEEEQQTLLIQQEEQQQELENGFVSDMEYHDKVSYDHKDTWIKKEWLESGVIPDKEIDMAAAKAYREMYGKKMGFFEKGKARKEFKKKFAIAKEAHDMVHGITQEKYNTMLPYKENLLKIKKQKGTPIRDAQNAMLYMNDEDRALYTEKLAEGTKDSVREAHYVHLKQFMAPIDFTRFEYKNDKELIRVYRENKELLASSYVLQKAMVEYENAGGDLPPYQRKLLQQNSHMLQTIKQGMEERLSIIQNSEYCLIRQTHLDSMNSDQVDALVQKFDRVEASNDAFDAMVRRLADLKKADEKKPMGKSNLYQFNGKVYQELKEQAAPGITHSKGDALDALLERNVCSIRYMKGFDSEKWKKPDDIPDKFLADALKQNYKVRFNGALPSDDQLKEMVTKLRSRLSKSSHIEDVYKRKTVEMFTNSGEALSRVGTRRKRDRFMDPFINLFSSFKDQKRIAGALLRSNDEDYIAAIKECCDKILEMGYDDLNYSSEDELIKKYPELSRKAAFGAELRNVMGDNMDLLAGLMDNDKLAKLYALGELYEAVMYRIQHELEGYMNPVDSVLREYTSEPDYWSMSEDELNRLQAEFEEKKNNSTTDEEKEAYTILIMKTQNALECHAVNNVKGQEYDPNTTDINALVEKLTVKHSQSIPKLIEKAKKTREGNKQKKEKEKQKKKEQEEVKKKEALELMIPESIEELRERDPDFTDEMYAMYCNFTTTSMEMTDPICDGYAKERQKKDQQYTLSRVFGPLMRPVEYDDKWEPKTEEDKKNYEWNLKWCESVMVDDYELQDEMISEEYPKLLADFEKLDFPSEQDIDAWADKQLRENARDFSTLGIHTRGLSNLIKVSPMAQKFEKEHPEFGMLQDVFNALQWYVESYCKVKYHFDPQTGGTSARATPEGPMFESVLEDLKGDYLKKLQEYKDNFGNK
jgi:hypothetical protein